MAVACLRAGLRRGSSLLKESTSVPSSLRLISYTQASILSQPRHSTAPLSVSKPLWGFRNLSHGSVNLVISQGKPKFETHEVDPPKKEKWQTKKRFKMQKLREKHKRKAANKTDPRKLNIKGKKKQKFANAEERIKYKLERAKIKEALLIEKLKLYEVPKAQGPVVKPHVLTGEERFYLKRMAQKRSNYVPIGRRGIFGGVILNMHMHWKKHETVKVICKPCKPGQVHGYAEEIARLSGGIPIQIIGEDTIIFYRGKDYVQPESQDMSPIDTLSKRKALQKSKYGQSLESVRRFIAIAEKELELYYRHIALYGDPNTRNPISILDSPKKGINESGKANMLEKEDHKSAYNGFSGLLEMEDNSKDEGLTESESDLEDESEDNSASNFNGECEDGVSTTLTSSGGLGSSSMFQSRLQVDELDFVRQRNKNNMIRL
ncbi:hypothetical protein HS088_TW16G00452 [Tripterygium wilfordii]|uniref:CRM domain-containing protein n=1 Tax=Tripterygium wilfordii TaxID=458696 RepID=A0A7J7CJ14_TRIWF|nr:uncharacterized CRM domain-containing protein At3g25440, chloroplastic [Tripterygium wilfordii]KAF5734011.1 hypothetical protein HS088_TW16G00452 [Tripterygium wilfordii]